MKPKDPNKAFETCRVYSIEITKFIDFLININNFMLYEYVVN